MAERDDTPLLLGRLAAALAGGAGLPAALELLVAELGLRSAVLRRVVVAGSAAGDVGTLLAVAGGVVRVVPADRPRVLAQVDAEVELAVPGADRAAAVLTVVGARPSLLPVLRAAAAVLGLALADAVGSPDRLSAEAAALSAEADEDATALADALHDGPVQSLVAARWACDAASRGADPALARDAVQSAVVALRRTMWHLRPRGHDDLPAALRALSAALVEADGQPLHPVLDDEAAARLGAPARALAYRVVQAVARDADRPVRVGLRARGDDVVLDVDGGCTLADPDRWRRRLRALGGDVSSSAGRLRLHLPAAAPVPTAVPTAVPADVPAPTSLPGSRSGTDTKACS